MSTKPLTATAAVPISHSPMARAPLSRAAQLGVAASLVLAGVLNGGAQYVGHLVIDDGGGDFSDQIRWGIDNPVFHAAEQAALLISMLFLPIAALGLAQVTRHRAPRLTALGILLALWGFWGFHNVVALGYTAGTIAPTALGVDGAVRLNDAFLEHPGSLLGALVPHLVGSFLGLLLLAAAGWRARSLPRIPLALLVAFLFWDFLLPAVGPFEAHLLLLISFTWLGWHVSRMSPREWSGTAAGGTY